jgi:hypothetical protein
MDPENERIVDRFREHPKRKLSDIEKELLTITIEKSRIQRERSMAIFDKGIMIFFGFLIVAYMNNIHHFLSDMFVNVLFFFAILVLIISIAAYQTVIKKEEKYLDELLEGYMK